MKMRVRRAFSGEGGGAIRARGIGSGHEFHDHRSYADGDDFRHIDWNLFGRHGDLYIKRFRQETDLEFLLILDRSASMAIGEPAKDVTAKRLACALAACFASQAQPFDIRVATKGLPAVCPRIHNEVDLEAAMVALEKLPHPTGTMLFEPSLRPRKQARNQVIIFIGDFLDAPDFLSQLATLKSEHCEVICALLCAEEERAPQAEGQVLIKDIEGEGSLRVFVNRALLDSYIQLFDSHLKECQKHAASAGLGLAILNTEAELDQGTLAIARRGALVR